MSISIDSYLQNFNTGKLAAGDISAKTLEDKLKTNLPPTRT